MLIDIDALSLRQLEALLAAARARKALLARRRPEATVREELRAAAAAFGYTIDELFGASPAGAARVRAKGGKRGKVAPKYRDPQNRRNTWSGRGRMPRWLAAKTRQGMQAADFLVPGLARPTPKVGGVGRRTVFKAG